MKVAIRRASVGVLLAWGVVGLALLGVVATLAVSDTLDMLVGGALIDLGYFFQDPVEEPEDATPGQLWDEVLAHNELAASVRHRFPRSAHHPKVALVVCMDARIDTNELVGDTRRYYYVVRLAGSVMSEREEEMLELAVANGVGLIVLTRHTECAAEHVASDPALRERYPAIAGAVDERDRRREEFLARPFIASHVADGSLEVREALIDTATGRLEPR